MSVCFWAETEGLCFPTCPLFSNSYMLSLLALSPFIQKQWCYSSSMPLILKGNIIIIIVSTFSKVNGQEIDIAV